MTLDDAMECDEITVAEAIAECAKHDVEAWVSPCGTKLFTEGVWPSSIGVYPHETIATIADGFVYGGDVLAFLGY